MQGQELPSFAGKDDEEHKEEQAEKEREQQRQRMLRRSRSAVELRSMGGGLARHGSTPDLQQLVRNSGLVELTNPEGQTYTAGRLSNEERAQKILRSGSSPSPGAGCLITSSIVFKTSSFYGNSHCDGLYAKEQTYFSPGNSSKAIIVSCLFTAQTSTFAQGGG